MSSIPKDFADALKTAGLTEVFSGNAPSHQREYLKWINEVKRPETRATRIQKAVKMVSDRRAEKTAHSKTRL